MRFLNDFPLNKGLNSTSNPQSLSPAKQRHDRIRVSVMHMFWRVQIGFTLRAFFSQNMAFKSTATLNQILFNFETLGRATISLHFWHDFLLS